MVLVSDIKLIRTDTTLIGGVTLFADYELAWRDCFNGIATTNSTF